ncbi:MAG TPA: GAF domain-containing protein, partial [Planctomycetaceae bacterium]|nr:GAF domain-containing protein [Planctomycetaceae bacterium]
MRALAERHNDEDALLVGIVRAVADAFEALSTRIWALSPAGEQLDLRAATGLVLPFEALQDRVPVRGSELGRVIQHREPCVIDCDGPATPDDVRAWAQQVGVASFLAVPIANAELPWGVLGLFLGAPWTAPQRELLSATATEIARMLITRGGESETADLLPSLIPCLSSAIITLDRTGWITRWSRGAERLFGWSETELLGKPLPIVPDEHRHEYSELDETSQRVNHSRTVCLRADLSRVPVLRTSAPYFDRAGSVIGRVEVFEDDSQRVHMSRCLHLQGEVTRILAGCRGIDEALPLLLAGLGNWLGCDVLEFWQRDETQSLLAPVGLWAKAAETRERLAATGIRLRVDAADWPARAHRDDEITYAENIVSPTASASLPCTGSLRVATAGLAIPIRSSERRWGVITCLGSALASPDELTRQTLGFTADALAQFLTRMQTETALARTEASLRQSQKMDALGLLAGGVAHDFNNLLTIILAYSELGLSEVDESHPLHELFAEIHGAGERAAGMTKKLLAVSRQQPTQSVTCSLNQ